MFILFRLTTVELSYNKYGDEIETNDDSHTKCTSEYSDLHWCSNLLLIDNSLGYDEVSCNITKTILKQ